MIDPTDYNSKIFPSQARFVASYKKSVNTSQKLSELGITLPANAIGVEVRNEGSTILRISPNGPATAATGGIAQYDTFPDWDTKDNLNLRQYYTGSATDVTFFIYALGD